MEVRRSCEARASPSVHPAWMGLLPRRSHTELSPRGVSLLLLQQVHGHSEEAAGDALLHRPSAAWSRTPLCSLCTCPRPLSDAGNRPFLLRLPRSAHVRCRNGVYFSKEAALGTSRGAGSGLLSSWPSELVGGWGGPVPSRGPRRTLTESAAGPARGAWRPVVQARVPFSGLWEPGGGRAAVIMGSSHASARVRRRVLPQPGLSCQRPSGRPISLVGRGVQSAGPLGAPQV